MTNILDALFCYYYVVCKDKVWFATDSYAFYAWGFVAGATSVIIFINTIIILSFFGYSFQSFETVGLQLSKVDFIIMVYAMMFIFMVLFGAYLLRGMRVNKLVRELKDNDFHLSPLSKKIGWVYKIGFFLPLCIQMIVLLFEIINTL